MIDFKWSSPQQVSIGNSKKWRREYLISPEVMDGFFNFWRKNKFALLSQGFSVGKNKSGKWVFYETKNDISLFKDFNLEPSKLPVVAPEAQVIFNLPEYKLKNIEGLRPWQIDAAEKLVSAINYWGAAADGSDLGCHAKGQLILMADGTLKKVEDIIIGDSVMGWKMPQLVTKLHRGRQQMARVIPIKGDSFEVNIDHILTVIVTDNKSGKHKFTGGLKYGDIYDISIRDYLLLCPTTKSNLKLLFSDGINTWGTSKQPFSPYFIGALLGDGGLSSNAATFTNSDIEIWNEIKLECDRFGWILGTTNQEITKRITNAKNLQDWRRAVGLYKIKCEGRFIPQEYKIADKHQRLELLAGLIDTDGHKYKKSGNGYCITLKAKQLAEDVAFVARSVGLATYIHPIKKKCYNNGVIGDYFNVNISGNTNIIPCRLTYKKSSVRKQKKDVLRRGFTIELLNEDDYYGFSLDGDGRFLLGDFTITHNTGKSYSAIGTIRELNVPFVIICPKAVINQWRKVIDNHFKLSSTCKGIINYELLIRGRKDSDIASFVLKRGTGRRQFIWKIPKNSVIIWDESHKLKNFKTKSSKCCIEAFKQGYKQLFASATMAQSPLDLRTIGTCLKMFKTSREYYDWADRHGVYKDTWGPKFSGDIEVLKKINKYLFEERGVRKCRDEIPNFPECEIIIQAYDIDEAKVAEINKNFKEMASELKRLNSLLKNEESQLVIRLRYRQKIELLKVDLFVDLANEALEAGMSVILFINYTETINTLSERLNSKCIYSGQISNSEKQKNIDDFQSNKERIFIVQVKSGGSGLNLGDTDGNHPRCSIISPDDSARDIRQACGRGWRENSKSKSIVKIPFANGTIESSVVDNMNAKTSNIDIINDGMLKII
jgi:hypothetical protein